ncbi:acid protease [Exidia glandulosa HHB12029]|uniref:Acid protease n=1 Tax=Exidia glandulosa HHB12029 TaxID=1314781 RepID=A0A165QI45_EXIGL|nr:acid protease [Exidia glandulosa HHB12029]
MTRAARALAVVALVAAASVDGALHAGRIPDFPLASGRSLSLVASSSQSPSSLHRRGQTGIDKLQFAQGSYNLIVKVGQVNLRVGIDTGSSDSWVVASSSAEAQEAKLPTYPLDFHSPSLVVVDNNETAFAVSYADTTGGQGFIARETFVLENFTISNQAFGLVQHMNVSFGQGQDGVSGVLGFGFPRLSSIAQTVEDAPPIMERLAQEGQLQYPLFGVNLAAETPTLSLGAIDSDVVNNVPAVEWHDVVSFGHFAKENTSSVHLHWALQLSSVDVDTTSIDITPTYAQVGKRSLALLDVGTDGFFGPYSAVGQIFDAIQDSRIVADGTWAIPCDTTAQMHFNFGGKRFSLGPEDYLIGEAQGNEGICLSWPVATPPSPDGIDWALGAPFLRTVYTVLSYGIVGKEPPLIGLYSLANNTAAHDVIQGLTSTTSTTTTTTTSSTTSSSAATPNPVRADASTDGSLTVIPTTLPNSLLETPTFTTPPYLFTNVPKPATTSGYGTSTYAPALRPFNITRIPIVALPVSTIVTTDTSGHEVTTTIPVPSAPPVVLGRPSAASRGASAPAVPLALALGVVLCALR